MYLLKETVKMRRIPGRTLTQKCRQGKTFAITKPVNFSGKTASAAS